ncbi:MAG: hypothetical protein O7F69_01725 [Alphaproteobacteria bacterium]|nr:hypothetical protein [Alphaproteobacteria bacterium]
MKFYLIAFILVAPLVLSLEARGAGERIEDHKSPLVILPPIEWPSADVNSPKVQEYFNSVLSPRKRKEYFNGVLSSRERQEYFNSVLSSPTAQVYFKGVLETSGFIFLKYLDRTPEFEQQFSDFRQCAENNRNRSWPIAGWFEDYSPDTNAAFPLIRATIPFLCEKYVGMGNGGRSPIDLVTKQEWQDYNAVERKFYVSAYIETVLEYMVLFQENGLLPQDNRVNSLVQCITDNGVEKIVQEVGDTEVETNYPMPWTVSKAVENVCAG